MEQLDIYMLGEIRAFMTFADTRKCPIWVLDTVGSIYGTIHKPIMYTGCVESSIEMINYSVMHDLSSSEWGFTIACKLGKIDIVKYLYSIMVNYPFAAFYNACKNEQVEVVRFLLGKDEWNSIHILNDGLSGACVGEGKKHEEIMEMLIERGARWCCLCHKPIQAHKK